MPSAYSRELKKLSKRILKRIVSEQQRIQEIRDYAFFGLDNVEELIVENPLIPITEFDLQNPHIFLLDILRQPKYFYLTVKTLLGIELMPFQVAVLQELWERPFPMLIGCRGFGKSFILGILCILDAVFNQGAKIVICGAGFRQAKLVFDYVETFYNNAPVLRSMFNGYNSKQGASHGQDMWTLTIGRSRIFAIPLGDGTKIRGLRATTTITDEFQSINIDVYENVVAGFSSVSQDPGESVKDIAASKVLKAKGYLDKSLKLEPRTNKSIISGTAYYDWSHFGEYFRKYRGYITSKGDPEKLARYFNDGAIPDGFDYRDYSIIRIPSDLLPEGYLQPKAIARAKATQSIGIFNMEFGCIFQSDSTGFFRRKLVESCVTKDPINVMGEDVQFSALVKGNFNCQYIFGVDTASENDNFSIVIIEVYKTHRRVVYCWTVNKERHREKLRNNITTESDFYSFCTRKIRDLMHVFPCIRIAIDSQGGGNAIIEALHDRDKMRPGEQQIWEVIDPNKEKETDDYPGLHIIEKVNLASADYTSSANHGMRKDFEDKVLLFPKFDGLSVGLAIEADKRAINAGDTSRLYDTLEDCILEIEELKDELSTIVHTQTANTKRDRWDTPEVLQDGRKGRLRKDRYSSLLMANMSARVLIRSPEPFEYIPVGGFAGQPKNFGSSGGGFYRGPAWVQEQAYGFTGRAVTRGKN